MINFEQMPQRIIDTNKRAEISHDIRKAVRDLQEAFRNLSDEQNICIPLQCRPQRLEAVSQRM